MLRQIGLAMVSIMDSHLNIDAVIHLREGKENSLVYTMDKPTLNKLLEKQETKKVITADEKEAGKVIISGSLSEWHIISDSMKLYVQGARVKSGEFVRIRKEDIIKFCNVKFQFLG